MIRTSFFTELLKVDTENHKDSVYKFLCGSSCLLRATLRHNPKD